MKFATGLPALAIVGVAAMLSACQQKQEEAATPPATPAADVTINPPPNVTVNPPDVNINPPDVKVTPPDAEPSEKVTRETTVQVPGVGSTTTTTVEKK